LYHRRRKIDQVTHAGRAENAESPCPGYPTLLGRFAAGLLIHQKDICLQFFD
jgi:hypothetical protein